MKSTTIIIIEVLVRVRGGSDLFLGIIFFDLYNKSIMWVLWCSLFYKWRKLRQAESSLQRFQQGFGCKSSHTLNHYIRLFRYYIRQAMASSPRDDEAMLKFLSVIRAQWKAMDSFKQRGSHQFYGKLMEVLGWWALKSFHYMCPDESHWSCGQEWLGWNGGSRCRVRMDGTLGMDSLKHDGVRMDGTLGMDSLKHDGSISRQLPLCWGLS